MPLKVRYFAGYTCSDESDETCLYRVTYAHRHLLSDPEGQACSLLLVAGHRAYGRSRPRYRTLTFHGRRVITPLHPNAQPANYDSRRFVYGYLRGLVRHKSCPAKISIKVAESDKTKMLDDLRKGEAAATERAHNVQKLSEEPQSIDNTADSESPLSTLPPLVHTVSDSKEGWIEFDKPLIYLMAGKGPLVARDLMQFPMSLPDDGVVDVVIQERSNRKEMLKAMDGAELGRTYWMDTVSLFSRRDIEYPG